MLTRVYIHLVTLVNQVISQISHLGGITLQDIVILIVYNILYKVIIVIWLINANYNCYINYIICMIGSPYCHILLYLPFGYLTLPWKI